MSDRILYTGWHWSFGWLRRPELDYDETFAYEKGNGNLIFSDYGPHEHAAYLACMQNEKTKKKYLIFSKDFKASVKSTAGNKRG